MNKYFLSLLILFTLFNDLLLAGVNQRTIAVIFTQKKDLTEFSNIFDGTKVKTIQVASTTIHELVSKDKTMLIRTALAGKGAVQSALTTERLLSQSGRKVSLLITGGVVGSLDRSVARLDWIRIKQVVAYQTSDLTRYTQFFEPKFSKPDLNKQWQMIKQVNCASGEQFVKDNGKGQEIAHSSQCQVVDMNLFGIISSSKSYNVQSFHFRRVSDYANENAIADFSDYMKNEDGKIGRLMAKIVTSLSKDKTDPASYETLNKLLEGH